MYHIVQINTSRTTLFHKLYKFRLPSNIVGAPSVDILTRLYQYESDTKNISLNFVTMPFPVEDVDKALKKKYIL